MGDLPGPARVGLLFRAGFVDEQPAHRGWTHLIEHLAFGPLAPADGSEGAVRQHVTMFVVEGSDAEVVRQLEDIVERLGRLPVERLQTELRVLAVEAAGDGNSGEKELCLMHFGYSSVGLASLKQVGLRHVDPTALQDFADTAFTRENAALVLSRPVEGLGALSLGTGQWRPSPPASPQPRRSGAAEQATEGAPVALGALMGWTPAGAVLKALLERRAWEVLRHERGLVYDVRARLIRVAPGERLLLMTCDARPQDASAAARALLGLVEDAAQATPEQVAVAQADIRSRQAVAGFSYLLAAAEFELSEGRAPGPDWPERVDRVSAADVCEMALQLHSSVLVSVPDGASVGLPTMERIHASAVAGEAHPAAAAGRERGLWDVTVGVEGVTATGGSEQVTVRFDDCIAVISDEEGAVSLLAADESELVVHPTLHQDGQAAVDYILDELPDALKLPPEPREQDSERRPSTNRASKKETTAVSRWLATQLKLESSSTTSSTTKPSPRPEPGTSSDPTRG